MVVSPVVRPVIPSLKWKRLPFDFAILPARMFQRRALVATPRAASAAAQHIACSRSWAGAHLTWDAFHQIKERTPLQRPKLQLPYRALQALAVQL